MVQWDRKLGVSERGREGERKRESQEVYRDRCCFKTGRFERIELRKIPERTNESKKAVFRRPNEVTPNA